MVCCSLRHGGEELLAQRDGLGAYAERGTTMGIPLLHPWANRLGDWSYRALGRAVERDELEAGPVRADGETGLPIHGTLPRRWSVVATEPVRLEAQLPAAESRAFPFEHAMRLEASVEAATLRLTTTLTAASGPVPAAFGFHPYLTLPGVARERYRVELPVRRRLVLDERKLPTGATEAVQPFAGPLGGRAFDDGYDELAQPPVFALEGGGRRIELRLETGFPVAQVYAPPGRDFACFEPMTARTNALRTGDFPLAAPGEPYTAAFSVTVAPA
jgi:aldose 1-epimerase